MDRGKKKSSGSREASMPGTTSRSVIALAVVGGMAIGSAGTYLFIKPQAAPRPAAVPAAAATAPVQAVTVPQPQFTPATQPPGEAPPGKVWSVEHGHWHDAPIPVMIPAPVTTPPEVTPAPAAPPVTPATVTPPPPAAPLEKKE